MYNTRIISVSTFVAVLFCAGLVVASPWNSANGLILKGTIVPMTAEDAVIENGQILIQNE